MAAFKQARNLRGRMALTPVPVKAEPTVLLVNTKLPKEQALSATDTALSRDLEALLTATPPKPLKTSTPKAGRIVFCYHGSALIASPANMGSSAGNKTVDGRLVCTIYITSMVDITIHQNAVDSDDMFNVLPFCIAVCDHTKRVNLPLESQDGVDAIIDNVEVYLIESGEGQRYGLPLGIDDDLRFVFVEPLDFIVVVFDVIGTCAHCDGKPVFTIVGRVAEGIVTCMHMNFRDEVVGFQVHQCHLVGLGFLEVQ
ncbi:unnamed protein product [Mytilus edulis]|uniref:Uncharacterized protein n=1 Tax=Mytilus edulis TaxID=6550 RepID=A0A8S3QTQ0_MYTED|nr:unnamed protein product [Mytilus edulis]